MESTIVENVEVMTTMNDVLEDAAGEVENVNDVVNLVQKVENDNCHSVTEAKESIVNIDYSRCQDFSRGEDVAPYDRSLSSLKNL